LLRLRDGKQDVCIAIHSSPANLFSRVVVHLSGIPHQVSRTLPALDRIRQTPARGIGPAFLDS
jgi:hypothetical protein